jgi:outer membrane protein insertion porin family
MRKSGKDFRILLVAALLAVASLLSVRASDRDGRPNVVGPTISGVSIKVDGGEKTANIEGLISIAPGEPYSLRKIDSTIRQIFKTELFSDIQVLKEGRSEIQLTFLLTRKLRTRNISFTGDKGLSRKKLSEGLSALRPDGEYSEDKLRRAAEELKEALKKEGYLNSEIQARSRKDSAKPFVDVTFEIKPGRQLTIKSIDFSGDPGIPSSDLKKKIRSREGEPYVPLVVEEDVSRLKKYFYALGFARADIAVEDPIFQEQEGAVALFFRLIPNERIRISVQGADVPDNLLKPIWEERIFEEWGILQSEARILSHLRSKGYVFATVTSSIEKKLQELHIIHEVSPGLKYKLTEVDFEGLHYFSAAELKRQMEIGPKIPLLGRIEADKLFDMPQRLKRLYETKGFAETEVNLNFRSEQNDIRAVFFVQEGPQRKIGRIRLRGASLVAEQKLRAELASSEGGPFFQPDIQKDAERLETFYLNQGVRGTAVMASAEKIGGSLFDVVFDIAEGRLVKIDKIIITGNAVTKRGTIERELKLKEGDRARTDRIFETKRNLEKLGIFSEVKIEEVPAGEGLENLVVGVQEGERNYISLGIGLETKNELLGVNLMDNVIRPRGTAEFIRTNIFGRASQLSLVTQFSLMEKRGVISWEEPYFFGLHVQTYLNAWLEREERVSYGYDQRGVSLSDIVPMAKDWVALTTLRWASTTLYFLDVAVSKVDRQHYPFSTTSISQSLIRDRRDDAFNPEKGSFFSAVVEWAYPLFKVESDYLKAFVKYQRFIPLFSSLNFSLTARGGLGTGRMPIHERFFGGGSNSFRGEPFDQLGPKDPDSQKPVGGKAVFLFNFELRFPLFSAIPNLSGAVFYDKGNVFAQRKDASFADLEDAVGLGLRYRTPLGPLRIDLGWNLDPSSGRKKPIIFVTIGNVF